MLHDVAEQHDVERLVKAADNSLNSQETFVEGWQVHFWQLIGVSILHAHALSPNPTIKMLIYVKRTWFDMALSKPWRWGVGMAYLTHS